MSLSSRFAIAIHALCVLANLSDRDVPSAMIADSININPVVARRILASLKAAGLVRTREGTDGGYKLARCPGEITLDAIYAAVEPEPLFAFRGAPANPQCPVGAAIAPALAELFQEAEGALAGNLASHTLAEFSSRLICPSAAAGSIGASRPLEF